MRLSGVLAVVLALLGGSSGILLRGPATSAQVNATGDTGPATSAQVHATGDTGYPCPGSGQLIDSCKWYAEFIKNNPLPPKSIQEPYIYGGSHEWHGGHEGMQESCDKNYELICNQAHPSCSEHFPKCPPGTKAGIAAAPTTTAPAETTTTTTTTTPKKKISIGDTLALYSTLQGRFMRMNRGQEMDASSAKGADQLPDGWTWERFKVVDGGNGFIALHNIEQNRFVRMNGGDMDASARKNADKLPDGWSWERFKVLYDPDGRVTLHNGIHNRFIRMNTKPHMDSSAVKNIDQLPPPDQWTWERFAVVEASPRPWSILEKLTPGKVIALHSSTFNRFIRMHRNGDMDTSSERAANALPGGWTWERFTVVDAGNGEIALHNTVHNRFVRMNRNNRMDTCCQKSVDKLPPPNKWTWERFKVVNAGDGQIALHCTHHNQYVRMNSSPDMDASGKKNVDDFPDNWSWERFTVVSA